MALPHPNRVQLFPAPVPHQPPPFSQFPLVHRSLPCHQSSHNHLPLSHRHPHLSAHTRSCRFLRTTRCMRTKVPSVKKTMPSGKRTMPSVNKKPNLCLLDHPPHPRSLSRVCKSVLVFACLKAKENKTETTERERERDMHKRGKMPSRANDSDHQ